MFFVYFCAFDIIGWFDDDFSERVWTAFSFQITVPSNQENCR